MTTGNISHSLKLLLLFLQLHGKTKNVWYYSELHLNQIIHSNIFSVYSSNALDYTLGSKYANLSILFK